MSRILLALDDGPEAESLLEGARSLARRQDADLWIVHVLDPASAQTQTSEGEGAVAMERLDAADAWLTRLLRGKGSSERPIVLVGDPPSEIVAAASTMGADTLVMGARPRAAPRLPGSTMNRVLELASLPIWMLAAL